MVGLFSFLLVASLVALVVAVVLQVVRAAKKEPKKPAAVMAAVSAALILVSFVGVGVTYHPTPEQIAERERIAAEKAEKKRTKDEKAAEEKAEQERLEAEEAARAAAEEEARRAAEETAQAKTEEAARREVEEAARAEAEQQESPAAAPSESQTPEPSASVPASAPSENPAKPETVSNSDWDIIIRPGHPTYYGSVELSHEIWDDVDDKKIVFADSYYGWGDKSILAMDSYRNSDLIRSVYVSFSNFAEPYVVDIDEILPAVASYMPFDVMDKYYEFSRSFVITPNEDTDGDEKNYVISYTLTDEGKSAYYSKEHEYSGSIDVIIGTNLENVVNHFTISFGTPRWMSSLDKNDCHKEEWECNLCDYRG